MTEAAEEKDEAAEEKDDDKNDAVEMQEAHMAVVFNAELNKLDNHMPRKNHAFAADHLSVTEVKPNCL